MDKLSIIQACVGVILMIALIVVYRRARKLHDELIRERELLQTLLNNMPDQIYFKDAKSRFFRINQSCANMLGVKTPEEALGKSDADFFRKQDAKTFREDDEKVLSSGMPLRDKIEHGITNGAEMWFSTTKAPIFDKNGNAAGIVGISRDISERIRVERRLSDVVSKARCILWNGRVSRDGDHFKWRIHVYSSEQICKEFGLDVAQKTLSMWNSQVHPEQMKMMKETSRAAILKGAEGYQQEFWITADDGTPRWVKEDVQITKVSENEWDLVGVALDITERKRVEEQLGKANEKLERLAREDTLTGLLNRRTILEIADAEWARWERFDKPFSLLIIDVDNFKKINDSYGHPAGDQALKFIADCLKTSVRSVDRVGRFGGEEFVIILPETTCDGAVTVANKAAQNLRNSPLKVDAHTLNLTISVGAATATKADRDNAALLQRADQALLQAKRSGKNCVIAAAEMQRV